MRHLLALALLLLALLLVACSMHIDIAPHLQNVISVELDRYHQQPSIIPTAVTTKTVIQTVTVPVTVLVPITSVLKITQTVQKPWELLDVHPTTLITTTPAWQAPRLLDSSFTVQICDPSRLVLLSDIAAEMAVATPLFALVTSDGITTTNTFGLPSYDPLQFRTLYFRDPALTTNTPCVLDQPWVWQEIVYKSTPDNASTMKLQNMTLAAHRSCALSRNLSVKNFIEAAATEAKWLDVIALQLPDGRVRLIRLIHPSEELCNTSGGGSAAKAALCERISCQGVYGQVVCTIVGCH